jgi:hypothetical protein
MQLGFRPFSITSVAIALLLELLGANTLSAAAENEAVSRSNFVYETETDRYFANERSRFTIRALDDPKMVERIEVSIDDEDFRVYSGELNFKTEGLHVVKFRAQDPVKNWSPLQFFRIYVDLTPPRSQAVWTGKTYKDGSKLFVQPSSVLYINAQDNLSGISKTLWQNGTQLTSVPDKVSFSKEGEYNVKYAATDKVGNQEAWQSLSFIVDSHAPTSQLQMEGFSFKAKDALFVNSTTRIQLASVDALSGVEKIEYQINEGPVTQYVGPLAPIGKKMELKYRSVDRVGNTEAWKAMTVLQDTKPPKLTLNFNGKSVFVAGKLYVQPGFSIQAAAQDNESGLNEVLITRDGKSFTPTQGGSFKFDQPGEYAFGMRAKDQVGNGEDSNPYIIVVDATPPTTDYSASQKLVESDKVFLTGLPNRLDFSAADSGVGIERIEISYDGKNFSTLQGAIDFSEWKQPLQRLSYRAVDRLGNTEPARSLTVQIKTQAPKVDLFVESDSTPNVPLSAIRKDLIRQPASEVLTKLPDLKAVTPAADDEEFEEEKDETAEPVQAEEKPKAKTEAVKTQEDPSPSNKKQVAPENSSKNKKSSPMKQSRSPAKKKKGSKK